MTVTTQKVRKRLINSAKTNSNRVHVTPRTKGWAVRKECNLRASKILETQKEAVSLAKSWIKSGGVASVVVHSKDGNFIAY